MNNIKCTPREFEQAYRKFQGKITTSNKFLKLSSRTYIQFSTMIKGNLVTYWIDSSEHPRYEGLF